MCIGKWHVGDQPEFLPTQHGFDHYLGLPYSNDMGGNGKTKNGRKPPLPLLRDKRVIEAPVEQDKLVELYTDEAIKFITANQDRIRSFSICRTRPSMCRSIPARRFKASRPMAGMAIGSRKSIGAPAECSTRCAT